MQTDLFLRLRCGYWPLGSYEPHPGSGLLLLTQRLGHVPTEHQLGTSLASQPPSPWPAPMSDTLGLQAAAQSPTPQHPMNPATPFPVSDPRVRRDWSCLVGVWGNGCPQTREQGQEEKPRVAGVVPGLGSAGTVCHLWLAQQVVLAQLPPRAGGAAALSLGCGLQQSWSCLEPRFAARRLTTPFVPHHEGCDSPVSLLLPVTQ